VYAANEGNASVVNVFKIVPGSLQVTDLALKDPGGEAIAVDGSGNLYTGGFAGGYSGYFIAVYAPGATSPSRTISLGFQTYGITAASNGTLYVVANNEVAEYAPGAASQSIPSARSTERRLRSTRRSARNNHANKRGWLLGVESGETCE